MPREALSADAQKFLATGQPPSWVSTTRGNLVFCLVLFSGLLVAMLAFYGGDVVRDHRLAGTWRPALDVKVGDAKCTRYWFLFSTCSINYSWTERGATHSANASFMVGLKSAGGAPVVPVRSTRDASVVTAYVAVNDWLINRTATLLVLSVLLVLMSMAFLQGLLAGRYKDGAAYDTLVAELRAVGAAMQAKEAGAKSAG